MEDYSKLRIDPGAKPGAHALRKSLRAMYLAGGAIIIAILATLMGKAWLDGAVSVKVATVSSTFPAQAHTLFNATGYVVPQRKADVASKATGRLESLHVEEGSRVTAGQVLARLENRDVLASRNLARNAHLLACKLRLTPGILPFALWASFAVQNRSRRFCLARFPLAWHP